MATLTELATQPSARTFDLEEIVGLVNRGRVRVPHFQREFRWELKDVLRLFDSIVHGYPIGSLLLWQRPAKARKVQIGALTIAAPEFAEALWVVDGQQRITSLANALLEAGQRDSRFSLSYDLQRKNFVSSAEADPQRSIPLPVVFDLRRLLGWFAEHPELADYVNDANDLATKIRKFTVPAYVVNQADVQVLQDIFDRMNSYGKRLSRAEVFSALYAPDEEKASTELTISRVSDNIGADSGFGSVDDDTVLRVILARRGPDVTREIRIEFVDDRRSPSEFPGESRDDAFRAGQDALTRAVDFLQASCGVPHVSLLPYRYLLVVLARYFAHYPEPSPRNVTLLRRWFWRAASVGPEVFKGSATGAMRALCTRVLPYDEDASVQGLLSAIGRPAKPPRPNLERFRTNEAATRIVLAALWELGPRSLADGEAFTQTDLTEALLGRTTAYDVAVEIFSRRSLPGPMRTWAANRLLLPARFDELSALDEQILAVSDNEVNAADVLKSHAIPPFSSELLRRGDSVEFLMERQRILHGVLTSFIERSCEWSFEDTPPLDAYIFDGEDDEGQRDDVHD